MTMASLGRTTRRSSKDNQVKASKGQQTTFPTIGLRTRSKNVMNTPSPRNHMDPGAKLVQQASFLSKIYHDENSNLGAENHVFTQVKPESQRSRRKSSNETRYSVSTCQSDPASLGEMLKSPLSDTDNSEQNLGQILMVNAEVQTVDFGVQVNSEDLDILDGGEVKSLDYYKKLAASRLLDVERISEDLNSSNLDLEQMTKVNEGLVEENGKLITRCEEYEEQLEFLVNQVESQSLEDPDETVTPQN